MGSTWRLRVVAELGTEPASYRGRLNFKTNVMLHTIGRLICDWGFCYGLPVLGADLCRIANEISI